VRDGDADVGRYPPTLSLFPPPSARLIIARRRDSFEIRQTWWEGAVALHPFNVKFPTPPVLLTPTSSQFLL
jgi:hypothetical protein